MNGAIADPCAKTSKPPTSTSSRIIGASHHFFRTLMKAQSSPISPCLFIGRCLRISELVLEVARVGVTRMPQRPRMLWRAKGVSSNESHRHTDRRKNPEVDETHEQRVGHPRDGAAQPHPGTHHRTEPRR